MTEFGWKLSDLKSIPKNGLRVLTTFAGGGGSSMGYKLAGYEIIGANEIDPRMACHYLDNMPDTNMLICPIQELVADVGRTRLLMNPDILDGSPPCSTFSTSGNLSADWGKSRKFTEGQTEQVLSELFFDFIRLAKKLKPRVVIAENVSGIIKGQTRGYVRMICRELLEIGYYTQLFRINAADYGVPQQRERIFFIARLKESGWLDLKLPPIQQPIAVSDACLDLPALTTNERRALSCGPVKTELWWRTKPGDIFSAAYASRNIGGRTRKTGKKKGGALLSRSNSWFDHCRLHPEKPSKTLTGASGVTHWNECRKMSKQELFRIQSFPDDYAVANNRAAYVTGMSVPPRIIEMLARTINEQWFKQ